VVAGKIHRSLLVVFVPPRKALTWKMAKLDVPDLSTSDSMVSVRSDSFSNPYIGDTYISASLPILCVDKTGLADTQGVATPSQTPGGAWKDTWLGGYVGFTSPVVGSSMTSLAVANSYCVSAFGTGWRMGEFHDGDTAHYSPTGWGFWGAIHSANLNCNILQRCWVTISD